MPRKLLLYRLRTLIVVALTWILFSVVFYFNLIKNGNDLGVHVSFDQFAFAFGIIGLLIAAILIFFLKPAFYHQPTWLAILLKLVIAFILFFVIILFDSKYQAAMKKVAQADSKLQLL